MFCSPHHEIFKNISYLFKFNLKFQFRIPEFKTTSIVHLATWPYQNYQLTTLIAKCIAQYTCYYKKEIPITKVHSIIMFICQSKCSSSMVELLGTPGFRTSVIRFRTSCLQGFYHLFRTSGNINTNGSDRI